MRCAEALGMSALGSGAVCSCDWCVPSCVHAVCRDPRLLALYWAPSSVTGLSCCLCRVWFSDENSNQSSVSDVYQLKVDSSTNSSPSPQQSESLSPAHTSDFRTDDSQPPTLGQEILEGESPWPRTCVLEGPCSCSRWFSSLESQVRDGASELAASSYLSVVWGSFGEWLYFPLSQNDRKKQHDWVPGSPQGRPFLYLRPGMILGFPWWLSSKESACSARDAGSIPRLGRSPGEGNGNPL